MDSGTATSRERLLGFGADALGATSLEHAVELRGRTGARTLACAARSDRILDEAVAAGVDIAVPSVPHLFAVARAARATRQKARVHVRIDLGDGTGRRPAGGVAGAHRAVRVCSSRRASSTRWVSGAT